MDMQKVTHCLSILELDVSNLSKCPRVYFTISKSGVINEMIPQNYHGKSHILVSLLQDYRRGSTYGQLVPIGFGLYKVKFMRVLLELSLLEKSEVTEIPNSEEKFRLQSQ